MYYDGANWIQEDEMGKLIDKEFAKQILSDLDRIKETLQEIQGSGKVEKKEPRKMAEILKQANVGLLGDYYWDRLSKAAIDAVTQCYNLYISDYTNQRSRKSFPEYLKEKML